MFMMWDPHTFKMFLEECMNEIKNGNRPGTYFNKTACQNICKDLDINQMKNKWDIMQNEFKYYDRLTILEMGLSIDPALFRDTVAVGDKAKVPSEFYDSGTPDNVQFVDITDRKEVTNEVLLFDDVDPFLTYDSSSKKGKGNKRDNKRKFKGISNVNSSYKEKLDTVFDVLLTRITHPSRQTTHSPTIEYCMAIVSTFPGFEEGSIGYLEELEVFLKKPAHQNFMVPKTNETKMEFLKRIIEKEK
uniref:Myb/SANT-like domain-containing protein n=1 Tax=Lactuca sativa TaxID=4236 RepID=A0A9R1WZY1_LACSA|nr:hypothetical protein LSAT_V11C800452430 [Lactuca sativa]